MLKRSLTLNEAETLYAVIGLITGSKGENETLQSNFDTGTHFSYALGRTQQQLKSPLVELSKQEQAARARVAKSKEKDEKEFEKLNKEVEEEIKSLRSSRDEHQLFGWRFSKLKSKCETIPGCWFWALEQCRLEEDFDWLNSKEIKVSRKDIYECFIALRELSLSNEKNTGAAFNIGNRVSFKLALCLKEIDPLIVEIAKRNQKVREGLESKEAGSKEFKQIDKEYTEWMEEKVSCKIYQFSIDEIPEECETIPSTTFEKINPIIKHE